MWNPLKYFESKATQGPTRSIVLDDIGSDFISSCLVGERITPQKAFKFYRENSSVATAVDMIADSFEQIQPILMKPDGSVIDKHAILDFLKNPNSYQTWSDFAKTPGAWSGVLYGEAIGKDTST